MDLRPRHCTADTRQDTGLPALDVHVSSMIMYVSAAGRTRGYVELMHLDYSSENNKKIRGQASLRKKSHIQDFPHLDNK